jgi:hypothetical protein
MVYQDHVPAGRPGFEPSDQALEVAGAEPSTPRHLAVQRAIAAGVLAEGSAHRHGPDDLGQHPRLGVPRALGIGFVEDQDAPVRRRP